MPNQNDLERLVEDIGRTAALAEVAFDRASVEKVVNTFADGFREAAIELRTTTKPPDRRGLSYRFVELDRPMEPQPRALEAGLLPATDRPVDRLVPELVARFEILGWGVDAEASYGIEKIWPFLAHGEPMEEAYALSSLPSALRENRRFFESHDLTHFTVVAADYRHESANVYFMLPPPLARSVAQIRAMLDDLGMPAPREMTEYAAGAVAMNVTARYDSPHIERLCFYVPAPSGDAVPVDFDPLLKKLVDEAPVAAAHRSFIPGATFTRAGTYTKLEIDYTGTTLGVLQRCMGVVPRQSGDPAQQRVRAGGEASETGTANR